MNTISKKNIVYSLQTETSLPADSVRDLVLHVDENLQAPINEGLDRLVGNDMFLERQIIREESESYGPSYSEQSMTYDGAKFWADLSTDYPKIYHNVISSLTDSIDEISSFDYISFLKMVNGMFLLGTDDGLYRSLDGSTWTRSNITAELYYYDSEHYNSYFVSSGTVLKVTNNKDFYTPSSDIETEIINLGKDYSISSEIRGVYHNGNTLYVCTDDGIVESNNDGNVSSYEIVDGAYDVKNVNGNIYTGSYYGLQKRTEYYGFNTYENVLLSGIAKIKDNYVICKDGLYDLSSNKFVVPLSGIQDVCNYDISCYIASKNGLSVICNNENQSIYEKEVDFIDILYGAIFIVSENSFKVKVLGENSDFITLKDSIEIIGLANCNGQEYCFCKNGYFIYQINTHAYTEFKTVDSITSPVNFIRSFNDDYIVVGTREGCYIKYGDRWKRYQEDDNIKQARSLDRNVYINNDNFIYEITVGEEGSRQLFRLDSFKESIVDFNVYKQKNDLVVVYSIKDSSNETQVWLWRESDSNHNQIVTGKTQESIEDERSIIIYNGIPYIITDNKIYKVVEVLSTPTKKEIFTKDGINCVFAINTYPYALLSSNDLCVVNSLSAESFHLPDEHKTVQLIKRNQKENTENKTKLKINHLFGQTSTSVDIYDIKYATYSYTLSDESTVTRDSYISSISFISSVLSGFDSISCMDHFRQDDSLIIAADNKLQYHYMSLSSNDLCDINGYENVKSIVALDSSVYFIDSDKLYVISNYISCSPSQIKTINLSSGESYSGVYSRDGTYLDVVLTTTENMRIVTLLSNKIESEVKYEFFNSSTPIKGIYIDNSGRTCYATDKNISYVQVDTLLSGEQKIELVDVKKAFDQDANDFIIHTNNGLSSYNPDVNVLSAHDAYGSFKADRVEYNGQEIVAENDNGGASVLYDFGEIESISYLSDRIVSSYLSVDYIGLSSGLNQYVVDLHVSADYMESSDFHDYSTVKQIGNGAYTIGSHVYTIQGKNQTEIIKDSKYITDILDSSFYKVEDDLYRNGQKIDTPNTVNGIYENDDTFYYHILDEVDRSDGIGTVVSYDQIKLDNLIGVTEINALDSGNAMISQRGGISEVNLEDLLVITHVSGCEVRGFTQETISQDDGTKRKDYLYARNGVLYRTTGQDMITAKPILSSFGGLNYFVHYSDYGYYFVGDEGLFKTSLKSSTMDDFQCGTIADVTNQISAYYETSLSNHIAEHHSTSSVIYSINNEKMPNDFSVVSGIVANNEICDIVGTVDYDNYINHVIVRTTHGTSLAEFDQDLVENVEFIRFKRLKSDVQDIYINIPTTNTYYIAHVDKVPNCNHNEGSIVQKNVSVTTNGSIQDNSTQISVLLDNSFFNIGSILNIEANGNSLPLKIYRETFDGRYPEGKYFTSIIKPTIVKSCDHIIDGKYLIELMCFGTDEQSIHIKATVI